MQSPQFDLDMVKAAVKSWLADENPGWFSAPRSSVDYVIHVFACDNTSAERMILEGLLQLEKHHFSQRVSMWDGVADEYGLEDYLEHNWYINFMIEADGSLEEISFHPCEKDMTLANGKVLSRTIESSVIPAWGKNSGPIK